MNFSAQEMEEQGFLKVPNIRHIRESTLRVYTQPALSMKTGNANVIPFQDLLPEYRVQIMYQAALNFHRFYGFLPTKP